MGGYGVATLLLVFLVRIFYTSTLAMRWHSNPNLANSCFMIGLLTLWLTFHDYHIPMSKIAKLCHLVVK